MRRIIIVLALAKFQGCCVLVCPRQGKIDERIYSALGTRGGFVGNIMRLGRSLHVWLFVGRGGEATLRHRAAAVLPRQEGAEAQGGIRRQGGGRGSWNCFLPGRAYSDKEQGKGAAKGSREGFEEEA
jgi:hypothetical protein